MDVKRRLCLPIYGLECPGAGRAIERELASTDGVLRAYVNVATNIADCSGRSRLGGASRSMISPKVTTFAMDSFLSVSAWATSRASG